MGRIFYVEFQNSVTFGIPQIYVTHILRDVHLIPMLKFDSSYILRHIIVFKIVPHYWSGRIMVLGGQNAVRKQLIQFHESVQTEAYITHTRKNHGANMGPTWTPSAPDGPHDGPMNLATRVVIRQSLEIITVFHNKQSP